MGWHQIGGRNYPTFRAPFIYVNANRGTTFYFHTDCYDHRMSSMLTGEEPVRAIHWYIPLPEAIRLPQKQIWSTKYRSLPIEGTETLTVSIYPTFVNTKIPTPSKLDIAMQALQQSTPDNQHPSVDLNDERSSLHWNSTVIEAVAIFHNTCAPTEAETSIAFDEALEQIRQVQRAFHAATKYPTPLVTREQLPSIVPQIQRVIRPSNDGFPGQTGIFIVHANTARGSTFTVPLTENEERSFDEILQSPRRPFFDYADLRRDAVVALGYYGNYRDAVLTAATSSEVLLDTLLVCLDWEDRKAPEETAQLFQTQWTMISRVKALYSERLKGRWETEGTGEIATWHRNTMQLRNRIVHGGISPSLEQARDALEGVSLLESFVAERLTQSENLSRYLHTAYSLVGYPGLDRRDLLSKKRLERLELLTGDNGWSERLTRYRTAVAMARDRRDGALPEPEVSNARLQLVFDMDGRTYWALWSEITGLAVEVDETESLSSLDEETKKTLACTRAQFEHDTRDEAIVVDVARVRDPVVQSEWKLEYHLIPSLPVMRP